MRTVRSECLERFVIFGERHLRHLLLEFVVHYDSERHHQGIGSRLICPQPAPNVDNATLGEVRCRSRLGGQLNFCFREAARSPAMGFRTLRGSWPARAASRPPRHPRRLRVPHSDCAAKQGSYGRSARGPLACRSRSEVSRARFQTGSSA